MPGPGTKICIGGADQFWCIATSADHLPLSAPRQRLDGRPLRPLAGVLLLLSAPLWIVRALVSPIQRSGEQARLDPIRRRNVNPDDKIVRETLSTTGSKSVYKRLRLSRIELITKNSTPSLSSPPLLCERRQSNVLLLIHLLYLQLCSFLAYQLAHHL